MSLERLRLPARLLVHTGSTTRMIDPHTAPHRLPSPPMTMALSSCSDSCSPKPVGAVMPAQ